MMYLLIVFLKVWDCFGRFILHLQLLLVQKMSGYVLRSHSDVAPRLVVHFVVIEYLGHFSSCLMLSVGLEAIIVSFSLGALFVVISSLSELVDRDWVVVSR